MLILRSHFAGWTDLGLRVTFKPYWKLGLGGMFMQASESWVFEMATIMAGNLGTTQLAASGVMLNICKFVYLSFPAALGIASSIRVGNILGQGKSHDARKAVKLILYVTLIVQTIIVIFLISLRNYIGRVFSNDTDVVDLVANIAPIAAYFEFFDGFQVVIKGVLMGMGRQKTILWINLIGFWCVGATFISVLTFPLDLGLYGIWWGLGIATTSTTIVGACVLYFKIKWQDEVRRTFKRLSQLNPLKTEKLIDGDRGTWVTVADSRRLSGHSNVRRLSGHSNVSVLGPLSEDSLRSLGDVQMGARRRSTQVTEISAGSGGLGVEAPAGESPLGEKPPVISKGDDDEKLRRAKGLFEELAFGAPNTPTYRNVEEGLGDQQASPPLATSPSEDYVGVRLATDPSFADDEDMKC